MVSVGGLASGLDTNSIINQLIEIERRPISKLQADIAELQQMQASFTGLAPRFSSLRAAARALAISSLDQPTATVSDDSVFSATVGSTAIEGRHDLSIAQLATANRIASQGWDDENATPISLVGGSFVVQVGDSGAQTSIAVTTSTTLLDLANAINAAEGDVSASIINDGTNERASRLVLTSRRTGLESDIQVVTNDTSLDFENAVIEAASADDGNAGTYTGVATSSGTYTGTTNKTFIIEIETTGAVDVPGTTYRVSQDGGQTFTGGFAVTSAPGAIGGNLEGVSIAFSSSGTLTAGDRFYVDVSVPELQAARDAIFTLDGITQTRSTNTVSDALTGVTLNLASTTVTPESFTVRRDDDQIVSAVQGLVEAYNGVFEAVRSEQTFDAETLEAGLLLGDRTANTILARLRQTLSQQVSGTGSAYDSLATLGMTSSRTGGLSLNVTELRQALEADRDGVLRVLARTERTSSSQLVVSSRPRERADGTYGVNISAHPAAASVAAGVAQTLPLASAETLTFLYSENFTESSPTTSSFSVQLEAGDTQGQVIDRLNSAFATQGVRLRAFAAAGILTIESTIPGADMRLEVNSAVAAAADSVGFGVGTLTSTGVDVAGTIDGQAASGSGGRLEITEGALAGLAINYTGTATGAVGTVTISTGAEGAFVDMVDELTSGSDSVLGVRTSAIQDQIDDMEARIIDKEEQVARIRARLEEQFAALEVQLSGLQSQADFLTNQLAQLESFSQRGSRNR